MQHVGRVPRLEVTQSLSAQSSFGALDGRKASQSCYARRWHIRAVQRRSRSDRQLQLIDSLLEVYNTATKGISLRPRPVHLDALVESVITEMQPLLSKQQATVCTTISTKRHTLKSQVVIETQSLKIICTAHGAGKEHDFNLFKRSKVKPIESIEVLADKGYQGIRKIHGSSYTPIKKSKKLTLTPSEKETVLRAARPSGLGAQHPYRQLAKQRIYVEHVIRSLKIFRILAQPYAAHSRHRLLCRLGKLCFPHRRRRFGLRFNLISSLYNYGLNFAIA